MLSQLQNCKHDGDMCWTKVKSLLLRLARLTLQKTNNSSLVGDVHVDVESSAI